MISILRRYFFKELFKVFLLIIFSFYFLFVLIDFSAHTKALQGVRFVEVVLYYCHQFAKQGELLLTVALLLASIKVLTSSNIRNELVALRASGISLKNLLRPFMLASFCVAFLSFLNFQFLQPLSLTYLERFEERYFSELKQKEKKVHVLTLPDNTLLLYHAFDPAKNAFLDAYWITNLDTLYHMQMLYPYEEVPRAVGVDLLKRNVQKELFRESFFFELAMPEMELEKAALFAEVTPPSWQSFTQLFGGFSLKKAMLAQKMADREAENATYFFYKLFMPFASLIALFAALPSCVRFGRHLPVFFIYGLSLFGIISFFTLVHSSVILGESQIIPPFWGLGLIFALFFFFSGWRYVKLEY